MLIDIRPRIRKPPFGVQIDWGHPLAQGLVACWLFNEGGGSVLLNLAKNSREATITDPTNCSWSVGPSGLALSEVLTTGTTPGVTISPALTTGTAFTWASRITPRTLTDGFQTLFTRVNSSGLWLLSSGKLQWYPNAASLTAITAGSTHSYMVTVDAGVPLISYYLDGVADGTAATTTATNVAIDSMFNDNSSETYNGWCYYQYFYSRVLPAQTAIWLHAEPYAFLLQPTARRWFVPVAAAGGGPVAGLRTLALTGVGR